MKTLNRLHRWALALATAVIILPASLAAAATLDGSWSGEGVITPRNGARERIRCRVRYVRLSAKVYSVSATCASASNTIRQTGELLMVRPNLFVGDFYNRQYDMRGRIRVVVRGSTQNVTLSSRDGSGWLRLRRR
jgi:hypothetical protein